MSQAPDNSLKSWIGIVTPVLTILGLSAYSLHRVAYSIFYGPLGVSPDEVGLGYAQSLVEAGVGLFLLTFAIGLIAAVLALIFSLVVNKKFPSPAQWRWAVLIVSFLILAAMPNSTIIHAAMRADTVQHGRQVKPVRTFYVIPAIPISAEPVTMIWTGSSPPDLKTSLDCMMYLGRADGIAVFYAPQATSPFGCRSTLSRAETSCASS
jgi:hypothetical protein